MKVYVSRYIMHMDNCDLRMDICNAYVTSYVNFFRVQKASITNKKEVGASNTPAQEDAQRSQVRAWPFSPKIVGHKHKGADRSLQTAARKRKILSETRTSRRERTLLHFCQLPETCDRWRIQNVTRIESSGRGHVQTGKGNYCSTSTWLTLRNNNYIHTCLSVVMKFQILRKSNKYLSGVCGTNGYY